MEGMGGGRTEGGVRSDGNSVHGICNNVNGSIRTTKKKNLRIIHNNDDRNSRPTKKALETMRAPPSS